MIFMQRGRRLDEVGAVTAVGVIFHDEWQVIGPALISFPWQDLPAEMFHCLETISISISLKRKSRFAQWEYPTATLFPDLPLSLQSFVLSNLKYSLDCFSCRL